MFKYPFHFLFFILLINYQTSAQNDSLNFSFGSTYKVTYSVKGQTANSKLFYNYLSKNDPALKMFKKGKNQHFAGQTLAYVGGFLIGWNIGDIMFNNKKGYTVGLVGLGIAAVSFPITFGGLKKSQKAIDLYNSPETTLIRAENLNTPLNEDEIKWNASCLIFRMPVYGPKINYLKSKINDSSINKKARTAYQKQLDVTIQENKTYFDILRKGFDDEFTAKKVYMLPDSSFKSFIAGNSPGFLNENGVLDPNLQCQSAQNYFIITGKDDDQLLFVDALLAKPDQPFPHKKNTFLPAFKKIWDRNNFIKKQIRYFNEKLLLISKTKQ